MQGIGIGQRIGGKKSTGEQNLLLCSNDIAGEWYTRNPAPAISAASSIYKDEPAVQFLPGDPTQLIFQASRSSRIISRSTFTGVNGTDYAVSLWSYRLGDQAVPFRYGVKKPDGSVSITNVSTSASGDRWSQVLHTFTADQNGEHELILLNAQSFDDQHLALLIGWAMVNEGTQAADYTLSSCPPASTDANYLYYQAYKYRVQSEGGSLPLTWPEFRDLLPDEFSNADHLLVAAGSIKKRNYLPSTDFDQWTAAGSGPITATELAGDGPGGVDAWRLTNVNGVNDARFFAIAQNFDLAGGRLYYTWYMRKGSADDSRFYFYSTSAGSSMGVVAWNWNAAGDDLTAFTYSSGGGAVGSAQILGKIGAWLLCVVIVDLPDAASNLNVQMYGSSASSPASGDYSDYALPTMTDKVGQDPVENTSGAMLLDSRMQASTPNTIATDLNISRDSNAWAEGWDPVENHPIYFPVLSHEPRVNFDALGIKGIFIGKQVQTLWVNSSMEDAASGSAFGGSGLSGIPTTGTNTFVNSGNSLVTTAIEDEYIKGAKSYEIVADAARLRFDQSIPTMNTGDVYVGTLFGVFDGFLTLAQQIRLSSSSDVDMIWYVDGVETGNSSAPSAGFHIVHLKVEATADAVIRSFRMGIGTSSPRTGTLKIIHMMITEGSDLHCFPVVTELGQASATVLKDEIGNNDIRSLITNDLATAGIYIHIEKQGGIHNRNFFFTIGDGGSTNRIYLWFMANKVQFICKKGTDQWVISTNSYTSNPDQLKILAQWEDQKQELYVNGVRIGSASSSWSGFEGIEIDTLTLGGRDGFANGNQLNGSILAYKLTDQLHDQSTAEAMTTI